MTAVLRADGVSVGYQAGVLVVDRLDLVVEPGEVVALLGPNGAGKTTTMLALGGELPLADGHVELLGARTTSPLFRRARRGLAFVTEERSVFMGLTLEENLRVGRCDRDQALDLFPELRPRLNVRAGLLSGGEQQMLTLARALARSPRILLADELSLGLAPKIVTRLMEAVRDAAKNQGTGVLLVEQHVRKVLHYCDRGYVMRRGRIALHGPAEELRQRITEIEDSYLTAAN
jgi:branched-chain amino acid transport system ATP-binding protein